MKQKILPIIPARAGSKGIPNKNIKLLYQKPLIAYTIEAFQKSGLSDEIWVSTDGSQIAEIAKDYGAKVIPRPSEYSHDTASTESALLHALEYLGKEGHEFDAVLTLPATSPLRKPETIRKFVEYYFSVANEYDAVLSLHETRDDYWERNEANQFSRLFPDAPRRRQERKPLYIENSALYITNCLALRKTNSILGKRTGGFVIDYMEAIDINESIDLAWVEFLLYDQEKQNEK